MYARYERSHRFALFRSPLARGGASAPPLHPPQGLCPLAGYRQQFTQDIYNRVTGRKASQTRQDAQGSPRNPPSRKTPLLFPTALPCPFFSPRRRKGAGLKDRRPPLPCAVIGFPPCTASQHYPQSYPVENILGGRGGKAPQKHAPPGAPNIPFFRPKLASKRGTKTNTNRRRKKIYRFEYVLLTVVRNNPN